ncbi:hypothetical protein EV13_1922 [Prochlorococcus sp. MIT 0702]|nr:hypothetical protein EV13_1922 [Prochlorococcus sp. MIT 0702]KGG28083.1 hypothetical protein EV12_0831 [Prochlorococcus sp. MIT 0701]KGG32838.1 hypothetical protein EV14_1980 [Prochlorococcus sp. MIT 0703]
MLKRRCAASFVHGQPSLIKNGQPSVANWIASITAAVSAAI